MQGIPADLHIDILQKLPIDSSIVRLRCVCKSWDALLSDPSFTSQNLFSAAEEQERNSDSPPVTMIVRYDEDKYRSVYSLHSCDTIEPLLLPDGGGEAESEFNFPHSGSRRCLEIRGCCNGVLLLAGKDSLESFYDRRENLTLWNPTTLETKLLPRPPLSVPYDGRYYHYTVGFGFDPETNDYKVVRLTTFQEKQFMEVYSLRNDSWRKREVDLGWPLYSDFWEVDQCHKGKLYWRCSVAGRDKFMWFDLSTEVLQIVEVAIPAWRRVIKSTSMLSNQDESLIAMCAAYAYPPSLEIWALLKFWVRESWTKLFVIITAVPDLYDFRGIYGITSSCTIPCAMEDSLVII